MRTKTPFHKLRLIWRTAPHTNRLVVGSFNVSSDAADFCYDGIDLESARSGGFNGYPAFPDLTKEYSNGVLGIFAARLPGRRRPDFDRLVESWGANAQMDDFELLGRTFGKLPTDMYELIPLYFSNPCVSFYSDLAGIQNYAKAESFRELTPGTRLELRPNPNNEYDCHAVEVLFDGHQVAHVKRVHSESICNALMAGLEVTAKLEPVRMNGIIQEVVVNISFNTK